MVLSELKSLKNLNILGNPIFNADLDFDLISKQILKINPYIQIVNNKKTKGSKDFKENDKA